MIAKLSVVLIVLTIIVIAAVVAAFIYFDNRAKEDHELEKEEIEYQERVLDELE